MRAVDHRQGWPGAIIAATAVASVLLCQLLPSFAQETAKPQIPRNMTVSGSPDRGEQWIEDKDLSQRQRFFHF